MLLLLSLLLLLLLLLLQPRKHDRGVNFIPSPSCDGPISFFPSLSLSIFFQGYFIIPASKSSYLPKSNTSNCDFPDNPRADGFPAPAEQTETSAASATMSLHPVAAASAIKEMNQHHQVRRKKGYGRCLEKKTMLTCFLFSSLRFFVISLDQVLIDRNKKREEGKILKLWWEALSIPWLILQQKTAHFQTKKSKSKAANFKLQSFVVP